MHRSIPVALSIVAAAAVAQAQTTPPAPTPAPRAADRYKSVRVLTDIAASDMIPTMAFIANSLGVTCTLCHTDVYESDEKAPKQRAREMILMTRQINDRAFGGRAVLTCQTCHSGRAIPSSVPVVENAGWNARAVSPDAVPLPAASAVVARYLDAVGRSRFEALRTQRITGTVTRNSGRTPPVSDTFELFQEKPASLTLTTKLSHPPEADTELSTTFLKPMLFDTAYSAFTVTGRDRVGDLNVVVVTAQRARGGTHTLWFDDASGLLVRRTDEIETPLGRLPERYDFSGYRSVDGLMVPGAIRWSRADYQIAFELQEVRHNVEK